MVVPSTHSHSHHNRGPSSEHSYYEENRSFTTSSTDPYKLAPPEDPLRRRSSQRTDRKSRSPSRTRYANSSLRETFASVERPHQAGTVDYCQIRRSLLGVHFESLQVISYSLTITCTEHGRANSRTVHRLRTSRDLPTSNGISLPCTEWEPLIFHAQYPGAHA